MRTVVALLIVAAVIMVALLSFLTSPAFAQGAGNALNFDGVDDYMDVGDHDNHSFTTAGSIFAWVYVTSTTDFRVIVTKQLEHWLGFLNGTYRPTLDTGNAAGNGWQGELVSPDAVSANEWHYIGYTLSGSTRKLYVDGVLKASDSKGATQTNTSNKLYIGVNYDINHSNFVYWFTGRIDEVRIWNRALSQEEIRANMNRTLTGSEENLVAYYTFDELNEEGLVPDLSGNSNHGMLMGDAKLVESTAPLSAYAAGEKIVYASQQDGQAEPDIYLMNPDGSDVVRLTTDPGYDGFPEISPDGTKIVWTSDRTGNHDIWVMNLDGTNQTQLTTHSDPEYAPSWSPDGAEIAYGRGSGNSADGIWKMNTDGTEQTELYNNTSKNDRNPSWSPDGTQIVFSSGDSGSRYLVTINSSDGSNATTLSTISHSDGPDWHPTDADKILYSVYRSGVFVHTLSTGSNDRLTTGEDFFPSYAPDGAKAAFFRNDSGVWTMSSDGTNQQLVQALSGSEFSVDYGEEKSADEAQIIFQDDFESYEDGSYPPSPWSNRWSGVSGRITTEQAFSGSKSFRLEYQPSWARTEQVSIPKKTLIGYEGKIYVTDVGKGANIGFVNHTIGAIVNVGNGPYIRAAGQDLAPARANQWYTIRTEIDFSAEKMDVYVDDVLVGDDLPSGDGDYQVFFIGSNNFSGGGTGVCYFDDVKVFELTSSPVNPIEPPASEETTTFTLPGGATMEMVWIEPGTFTMGSPSSEPDRDSDEGPQHEVTITKGFYLGKYELTQAQWESVMGTRPWSGQDYVQENPNNPAVYISWNDVQALIARLNEAEGTDVYRLPTEAEWEYACRAGTTTRWSFGDDESQLGEYAWYDANAWNVGEKYAHAVGTKLPNPWGVYDMHGNVWEWVQDWYGSYSSSAQTDPTGPATGSVRVLRGGYFRDYARAVRSADRLRYSPGYGYAIGARLLRQTQAKSTMLRIDPFSSPPASTLTIPITVSDATGIAGGEIVLTYNPDLLTPVDVQATALTQGFTIADTVKTPGKLGIILVSGTGIAEGSGSLVDVTFEVSATAAPGDTSALVLETASLYDEDTQPFTVEVSNGLFTVISPDLAVSALSYDFGTVTVGEIRTETVTLYNRGNADLTVSSIGCDVSAISLSDTAGVIGPGDSLQVTITYTPEAGELSASLMIQSDDPDEGTITVALTGLAVSARLGDINADGIVDVRDAILCLRIIAQLPLATEPAGHIEPTAYEQNAADVNEDGSITEADALLIVYMALDRIAKPVPLAMAGGDALIRWGEMIRQGEVWTVPVLVEGRGDLYAGGFQIRYNPSMLAPLKVDAEASGTLMAVNTQEEGRVWVSLVNADGMVGEEGKVLNIRFKVKGERVHDGEIAFEQVRVFDGNAGRVVVRNAQEASVLPTTYLLFQNFPNPFNPSTEIRYQLPEAGLVRLVVYDLLGRTVRVLVDGPMEAGIHAVAWDGKDGLGRPVGSGIVLVRMEVGGFVQVRKMVLMR